MAVRQLRTYLRGQKGARSLPRLRASPELFPGQSGKLLIKTNNTLTYLISCSVGCFQPTEIFYAPPRFYSPHFFCLSVRIPFLFPALPFYRFADSLFPLPKLLFSVCRFSVSTLRIFFLSFATFLFYSLFFYFEHFSPTDARSFPTPVVARFHSESISAAKKF